MAEISKTWYKIISILVKYIPIIIALCCFMFLLLDCVGIYIAWLSLLFYPTLLPMLCILAFSFLLKFCIWHRLPIYYALILNVINWIDYYICIPVCSEVMIIIYSMITLIFIILGMYIKNRHNKK